MNKDNELFELLLKLDIKKVINDSNTNIEMINKRIKIYQTLISDLEDNKPLFFQKKELLKYNKQLDEYKAKIIDLYREIEDELQMIDNFSKTNKKMKN